MIQTTDSEERNKKLTHLDQLLVEEAPFVVLYYDEALRFLQPNVKGMHVNPVNMLELKKVYKE